MPSLTAPLLLLPSVSLLNCLWGLILLLFGYRLFRLFLALSGGFLGAQFASRAFPSADPAIHLIIIAVSALITSLVAFSFYSLTFLFLGAVAGAYAAASLASASVPIGYLYILGAFFGALLGWALKDLVIVLATAIGGTATLIHSLPALATLIPALLSFLNLLPSNLLFVTLTTVGILFQLFQYRPR